MAANTALPGSEPWLWTTTYLGHLYWGQGDLDAAPAPTAPCCGRNPTILLHSSAWRASDAARGDKQAALTILRPLAARLPLPEFLAALGDLYAGLGDARQAQEQYELVHVIQQLNAGAGMNVDLELATFDVMHGADSEAALAAAHVAYREQQTHWRGRSIAPATTHLPGATAMKRCALARVTPCSTRTPPSSLPAWVTLLPQSSTGQRLRGSTRTFRHGSRGQKVWRSGCPYHSSGQGLWGDCLAGPDEGPGGVDLAPDVPQQDTADTLIFEVVEGALSGTAAASQSRLAGVNRFRRPPHSQGQTGPSRTSARCRSPRRRPP